MSKQYGFSSSLWPVVLLMSLLCGLTACDSSNKQSSEPAEIRIGIITPLSGDSAENAGLPLLNACTLAVQQVNDQGGLDVGGRKHKVKLIPVDDQDNPQVAVSIAQKLVNQSGVAAIVGVPFSRVAIPVAAMAETLRIPLLSTSATNPDVTAGKQYAFRTCFIDSFQGTVTARFALESLGARKAAVMYDVACAYNSGLAEFFKQQFEKLGGQVVAFESYTTGEKDFSAHLGRIKESGAEVLFLPNIGTEVSQQAQQARQMGISIPLVGGDGWSTIPANERAPVEGGFFCSGYAPDMDTKENRAFVEAYSKAYNQETNNGAALAYDACHLLFHAIQNQGKIDPESIRAGLAGTSEYIGVTGITRFQGSGDPIKSAVIIQAKDNNFVFHKQVNP